MTFKKEQKYAVRQHISQGNWCKSFPHFAYSDDILEQARFSDEGKAKVNLMSTIDNLLVTEGLLKGDITASVAKNTRLSQCGEYLCYLYGRSNGVYETLSERLNSKG